MRRSTAFVYSGIRVRNLARSIAFYRGLGFRVVKHGSFSHGGRYVHLAFPGSDHRLELNFYPKGSRYYEPPRAGAEFDHFGFSTDDPIRWLRRAKRAGAKFVLEYVDRPDQRLVFVRDPDGVWLGVYGPVGGPTIRRGPVRSAQAAAAREPPRRLRSDRSMTPEE